MKARSIAARGSSGQRLFISAFTTASKTICDDTHSKFWCIAGWGMFALREINQMGRETCSDLERQRNIEPTALKEFEACKYFKGPGSYQLTTLYRFLPQPFAYPKPSTSNIPTPITISDSFASIVSDPFANDALKRVTIGAPIHFDISVSNETVATSDSFVNDIFGRTAISDFFSNNTSER